MKTPLPADLMFTWTENSIISQGIGFNTHMRISHVQVIIDVGVNGTLQVVSADAGGLADQWVIPEKLDWYGVLTCPDLSLRQRDDICQWAWDHRGIPYDFLGLFSFVFNIDLSVEGRLFCSGACFENYQRGANYSLLTGIEHQWVSPRDLYISPALQTLDGSPKENRACSMTLEEYTRFRENWVKTYGKEIR